MQRGGRKVKKALKAGMQMIMISTKSDLGKKFGGKALQHAPILFKKGVFKIKNDKVRRVLNFELANTAANHKSEILNSQRNLISQDKQQKRNHKF